MPRKRIVAVKYVCRRLLQLIPILLGITFLSFAMMHVAGSDVVTQLYTNRGVEVSQEIIDAKSCLLYTSPSQRD